MDTYNLLYFYVKMARNGKYSNKIDPDARDIERDKLESIPKANRIFLLHVYTTT